MAFDYVKCKLKLPSDSPFEISEYDEYQTKHIECEYNYYEIDENGHLYLILGNGNLVPQDLTESVELHGVNDYQLEFNHGKVESVTCCETNITVYLSKFKDVK